MPTSYSDLLRLAKQAVGENNNTWGDIFNENTLELIEEAIAGVSTIAVTAGNVTLTTANGVADQSRAAVLRFTGTPGATRTVTIPSVNKVYIAHNDTSDGSSVTITAGSGDPLTLPNGKAVLFFCNSTSIIEVTHNSLLVALDAATQAVQGLSVGTAANNLVQLDGDAKLPAVDGSQLTNLPEPSIPESMLVGFIVPVPYSTPDTNYLECNGAAISRETYSALFAKLGTTWGAGNGTTTFNLPDFRGEFLRGWDNGRGIDAGRAIATSQADELKAHSHTVTGSNIASSSSGNGTLASAGSRNTSVVGGSETRPRNVSVMYQIKAL